MFTIFESMTQSEEYARGQGVEERAGEASSRRGRGRTRTAGAPPSPVPSSITTWIAITNHDEGSRTSSEKWVPIGP